MDQDRLVRSLQQATQIPSVTGYEGEFSLWLQSELNQGGWDRVWRSEAEAGRPNVYAQTGNGSGKSVLLAGHIDTVAVDDWEEKWVNTEKADPFGAIIEDGEIWGRGVADQKGGICTILEATRAIAEAGYELAGEVTAIFLVDEESGQPGSGVSLGMKHATAELWGSDQARPDFGIYTEPTTRAIYVAQMGFLIADITLTGRSAYFGTPELGIDALAAGHQLLTELWKHNQELDRIPDHHLLGSEFLLVTEVGSGGNIAVPGEFRLSLIRKLLPGSSLDDAASQIAEITQRVASETQTEAQVNFSAGRDHPVGGTPDETDPANRGVSTLVQSIHAIDGEEARIEGAPYWSEKSFLSGLGIPTVYFGPGDISHCHTPFEHISITDLCQATKILAHFLIEWCGIRPQNKL